MDAIPKARYFGVYRGFNGTRDIYEANHDGNCDDDVALNQSETMQALLEDIRRIAVDIRMDGGRRRRIMKGKPVGCLGPSRF